jgi:pimeloyl-ACP methyl ester carboxylesterase
MRHLPHLMLVLLAALSALVVARPARAAAVEYRVPLNEGGTVSRVTLWATIGAAMGQPATTDATPVALAGDAGRQFVTHLVDTLGSAACAATVDEKTLTVRLDSALAHKDPVAVTRLGRLLASGSACRPAIGSRFGLTVHHEVFLDKPMTVMIHGLDSGNEVWEALTQNMVADGGWQAAFFQYPDDGPLNRSAEFLADCLADLRLRHPTLKINLLCHSMGGLIARSYVEGPLYRPGTIGKLVMVGTPNQGSPYTRLRWALEWAEHYRRCKKDKDWNWARMKEDGNGEAADDMRPGSEFLRALNACPRRADVAYTIIAGNQSVVSNVTADWINCTADCLSGSIWGLRHARQGLLGKAQEVRLVQSDTDGPVPVENAKLQGVADFHVLHADHIGLIVGYPPKSWDLIRDRLKK